MSEPVAFSRYAPKGRGYELSSKGDRRFSALNAQLADGRSIESHYQCDVKQYQPGGTDWRLGKGKPPLDPSVDLWSGYLGLWRQWARLNPLMIEDLRTQAAGLVLTDMFASSPISQARALAQILNDTEPCMAEILKSTTKTTTGMADLAQRVAAMTLELEFIDDDSSGGMKRFAVSSASAGMTLTDPFKGDGLFDDVDPVTAWGVPLHDATVVRDLNNLLEDAANEAIRVIQEGLGVKPGEHAGLYFSGAKITALHNDLANYLASELRHSLRELDDGSPKADHPSA